MNNDEALSIVNSSEMKGSAIALENIKKHNTIPRNWYIKRYGSGSSIFVGLHGWAGSYKTFDPIVEYIPPSVSFFCIDLPGYGNSDPPEAYHIQVIASEVANVISSLGYKDITLVVYCLGGVVALYMAPLISHLLKKIIFMETFAFVPNYWSFLGQTHCGACTYYCIFENSCGSTCFSSIYNFFDPSANLKEWASGMDHTNSYNWLNAVTDESILNIEIVRPQAHRLDNIPIVIAVGANTFEDIPVSAELLLTLWPHAKIIAIPNSSHYPIEENSEFVADLCFMNLLNVQ
eukprot:TRINITY_DN2839_c0_g1_i2.p1 TRINITY_DN2839_c0_g1~~TRINITY_DN2839_c0_g1_i2.p1  ORF type:complete len:290 (+),score=79.58 TRINITY_DN2839_c0_g1_i2:189-1058(+)